MLLYLEFLILLLLLWIYGYKSLIIDMNFMFTRQLDLFKYLKYMWFVTFFVILLLIVLEWVLFYHTELEELIAMVFILSPFLMYAVCNTIKYCKHGVKTE